MTPSEIDADLDEMNREIGLVGPADDFDGDEFFRPTAEEGYGEVDDAENTVINDPVFNLPSKDFTHDEEEKHINETIQSGIRTLRRVRIMTNSWVAGLGPVEEWARIFQEQYDAACERQTARTTQEEVDEFLKGVEAHVQNGKNILLTLTSSPVICPPRSHEAWGDFLAAGELMTILHRGIALLEVRLDILAPRTPFLSQGDSHIRRFKGLAAEF